MAVIVCGSSWNRVRADHALEKAMRELQSAQSRRNNLLVHGRGNTTRAQVKAATNVAQAVTKVKTAGMRLAKSERVWASCSRKSK